MGERKGRGPVIRYRRCVSETPGKRESLAELMRHWELMLARVVVSRLTEHPMERADMRRPWHP